MSVFQSDLLECQEASDSVGIISSIYSDEHNSLYSLFSEPGINSEEIILGPAEVQYNRVISKQACQDNTVYCICNCELFQKNQDTSAVQCYIGYSLNNQLLYKPTVDKSRSAFISDQFFFQNL